MNDDDQFQTTLRRALERDRSLYRLGYIPKNNGKKREIHEPVPSLKRIQKKIKLLVEQAYRRPGYVFGFSGGSVIEALQPHAAHDWPIFCADVYHAFPHTNAGAIFNWWREHGCKYYSSFFLTALTTWPAEKDYRRLSLPQGSPCSPWLFDACFDKIDEKIAKLAANVGGCYTRYADNLFFSAPTFNLNNPNGRKWVKRDRSFFRNEQDDTDLELRSTVGLPIRHTEDGATRFASPLISAIFRAVQNGYSLDHLLGTKRLTQLGAHWQTCERQEYFLHKCYLWHSRSGHDFLGLGLRIRDGQIFNSRKFKEDLHYLCKRLVWQLDHDQPFETEIWPTYQQLKGKMSFAVRATLPHELLIKIDGLLEKVESIRYSGPSGTWNTAHS